jgi:hypothetical protein
VGQRRNDDPTIGYTKLAVNVLMRVRMVVRDTTSSRAMSGPSKPVPSSRSTCSLRFERGSINACVMGGHREDVAAFAERYISAKETATL